MYFFFLHCVIDVDNAIHCSDAEVSVCSWIPILVGALDSIGLIQGAGYQSTGYMTAAKAEKKCSNIAHIFLP